MSFKTIQLSTSDKISAFDYSEYDDILVVSTKSKLAFYRLDMQGSPEQIIHYEMPKNISKLKIQKGGNRYISTLESGLVSFWDPTKTYSPLLRYKQKFPKINDFQWNFHDCNLFATSTLSISNGQPTGSYLSTWDIRSSETPIHQMSVGKHCDVVEWCPHSSKSYLISAMIENKFIFIWDVRKIPTNSNVSGCYDIIESNFPLCHYSWDRMGKAIYTLSGEQNLMTKWNIDHINSDSFDLYPNFSFRSIFFEPNSKIYTSSLSNRLMIQRPNPSNTSFTYYIQNTDFNQSEILRNGEHLYQDSYFTRFATSSSKIIGSKIISKSIDSVLKYSSRFIKNEGLILLSEDANLYTISFDDILSNDPNNVESKKNASNTDNKIADSTSAQKPKFSVRSLKSEFHKINESSNSVIAGTKSSVNKMKELLKNSDIKSKKLDDSSVVGPLTFISLLEDDIFLLKYVLKNNKDLKGIRIGLVDHFWRRVIIEVMVPTIDSYSLTSNEQSLYNNDDLYKFMKYLSSFQTIDLSINFPIKYKSFWQPNFSIKTNYDLDFVHDDLFQSIIDELKTVTRNYHERGGSNLTQKDSFQSLLSDFTIRTSSGFIIQQFVSECLLYQLVKKFREKILKAWNKKINKDRSSLTNNSMIQNTESILSLSMDSHHYLEEIEPTYFKFIDKLAFKVPFPVTSAGIFSPTGRLVCFGNASFSWKEPSQSTSLVKTSSTEMENESSNPSNKKKTNHKSYAHIVRDKILIRKNESLMKRISSNNLSEDASDSKSPLSEKDHSDSQMNSSIANSAKGSSSEPEKEILVDKNEDELGKDDDYQFTFDDDSNRVPSTQSLSNESKQSYTENPYPSSPKYMDDNQFSQEPGSDRKGTPAKSKSIIKFQISFYKMCGYKMMELASNYYLCPQFEKPSIILKQTRPGFRSQSFEDEDLIEKSLNLTRDCIESRLLACDNNIQVALDFLPGNHMIVQIWKLVKVALNIFSVNDSGGLINWETSSLGCTLFIKVITFLLHSNDILHLGMLICIVGGSKSLINMLKPFHKDTNLTSDEMISEDNSIDPIKLNLYFESLLYSYSDILRKWGLFSAATEVFNYIDLNEFNYQTNLILNPESYLLDISAVCLQCGSIIVDRYHPKYYNKEADEKFKNRLLKSKNVLWCSNCKDWAQDCSICQLPVRGSFLSCPHCGHGGHQSHLMQWFSIHSDCPTGCGCQCLISQLETDEFEIDKDDSDNEFYYEDVIKFNEPKSDKKSILQFYGQSRPNHLSEFFSTLDADYAPKYFDFAFEE